MKNKKGWETKSLEWIHNVREEIDREINEAGMSPSQWIKSRCKTEVDSLCKKLGLENYTIVKKTTKI